MTLTVPFSKTLDALAEAKAAGQTVYGMTRKEGAYKLDMSEQPRVAAPTLPSPEPRTSPLETVGRATGKPATAPVMVQCFDCGTEHPEGEDCTICAPLLRAAALNSARRRAYHLWKRGERPKPI